MLTAVRPASMPAHYAEREKKMTMVDVLLDLKKEDGYAILTINKPDTRNAMRMTTLEEFHSAMDICEKSDEVRCLIITASGEKAFSSGGDLNEELRYSASEPHNMDKYNRLGCDFVNRIMKAKFPVLAAINGAAVGAAVCVIIACDMAVSVEHAIFATPTSGLGGMPGWGSQVLMPWALGRHNAAWLLLGNERLNAEDAKRIGLIEKILKPEELMPYIEGVAKKLASLPPQTISAMKKLMVDSASMTLDDGIAAEADVYPKVNSDPNFAEGIKAFLEKRPPKFSF